MTKEEYVKKAIALYREKEKQTGRDIIGNFESFLDYVDQEYDKGTPIEEI
jgi:hypothetical protein